jgi:hypothetical protein
MKKYLLLPLLWALSHLAAAQQAVQLKNGSVIRGKVLQEKPTVRIETYDKSLWVFQPAEVESISASEVVFPHIQYKSRGFVHYTELGPLAMSNRASNGVTTSAFSFQTVNGYKFNQWLFTGLSVGADLYAVQTFVPIMLSLRGDFSSKGNQVPFYFVEGGYGLNATSNDLSGTSFEGGEAFAAGLGLKLLFHGNTGFVIAVGYRFQRSSVVQRSVSKTEDFGRLSLRAGFSF